MGKEVVLKINLWVLAACSAFCITEGRASQTYTDDFSQANGAPQGWVVVHPSVLIKNQTLSFAATGGSSSDIEPHAYLALQRHFFPAKMASLIHRGRQYGIYHVRPSPSPVLHNR